MYTYRCLIFFNLMGLENWVTRAIGLIENAGWFVLEYFQTLKSFLNV